ncbi:hypothetical protein DUI87_13317 [Hirundo rustica rustica]|uniref:DNA/RNA non-specific endonuclease domain-containing protein n=1 Tax=Hirundo rustica rustica TaxID=333673 RepID=A0A3M0KBJ1_HIRRU|nr:hypothetical protein DUI87_13317 [Hirundo rustica rustica]
MLRLLLLQVLASCLWLGHSEVVTSFEDCHQFFYERATPSDALHPKKLARICQRYSNSYHYATLYDRDRRIPVYSAYIYGTGSGKKPHTPWFVEPSTDTFSSFYLAKLINETYLKDMDTESSIEKKYKITAQQIGESQAINQDYNNLQDLNRGHLSPSGHQSGNNSKTATFTLTNIVPQNSTLNKGAWNDYETKTMAEKTEDCKTTYVITGAVPGNTNIPNNRVNVPSHIWSAACCLVNKKRRKAWAVIAENDKNEVENLSLGDLEARLTELYKGKRVTLFSKACPR